MSKERLEMLSVVIPAYNEEKIIHETANVISTLLGEKKIEYEIVFVNDGSKDKTWENICIEGKNNSKIRGVCFSRNFGKESAMYAGLAESHGDCVVVIDCDLQHPPEKIIEMYRLWEQGYEIVEGIKEDRGTESVFHSFAAKCFYHLISKATGIDMSSASDFKLLDRRAVNALLNMPEKNAFFRALSSWIGFRTTQVKYKVQDRVIGESKWSTKSLIKYAITNITSFTSVPMQLITVLGTILIISAIVILLIEIIDIGWNSIMVLAIIQCLIGGILMIGLGIIGFYIAKIYDEVKSRPKYIIAERCNEK